MDTQGCSVSYAEKTIFAPLCCLCSSAISIWLHLNGSISRFSILFQWFVFSFTWTTVSCLLQVYHKSWSWLVLVLTLFSFNIELTILLRLEWICQYPQNNLLGFLLESHCISRSNCEELTSWQYWVFLSMNLKYLSINLILLWYLSSEFCSFPHIYLVHILLDLHQNISVQGY